MSADLRRFTSRKFLLALTAVITAVQAHQYVAAAIAAVAYLVAEGLIDASAVRQASDVVEEIADDVDTVADAVDANGEFLGKHDPWEGEEEYVPPAPSARRRTNPAQARSGSAARSVKRVGFHA